MKKSFLILAAAAMMMIGCSDVKQAQAPKLNNEIDTLTWVLGENVGRSMVGTMPFEVNEELLLQAISHTMNGGEQPINDTVYNELLQLIALRIQKHNYDDVKAKADVDQEAWFAKLEKENPNVVKHPSGFYYEVIREGKGPKAKLAQRIRFDYRSYLLLTGELYDQTYERREPIIHVVGNPMFPGLIEAFQMMNAGSIYRFYFPYQMLAGDKSSGSVKAFTPMIYEIELHELYKD